MKFFHRKTDYLKISDGILRESFANTVFSYQKLANCVVLDLFSYQIVFILKTPCGLE